MARQCHSPSALPRRASRRGAPGGRRAPGGATMHIKRQRGWEIPEHLATPEAVFLSRRSLLGGAAGLAVAPAFGAGRAMAAAESGAYPAPQNGAYTLDRPVTPE